VPFNREYRPANGGPEGYYINRDRTGPPVIPSTGTTVESGAVVADSSVVAIVPSKVIPVTMPGPREPVLNASGIMAPRWRRFFEELYRRTGALEDNVNGLTDRDVGLGTTGALAFTGAAPTVNITHIRGMSLGSATLTGQDVEITNTS
jgi:hypothetical protein